MQEGVGFPTTGIPAIFEPVLGPCIDADKFGGNLDAGGFVLRPAGVAGRAARAFDIDLELGAEVFGDLERGLVDFAGLWNGAGVEADEHAAVFFFRLADRFGRQGLGGEQKELGRDGSAVDHDGFEVAVVCGIRCGQDGRCRGGSRSDNGGRGLCIGRCDRRGGGRGSWRGLRVGGRLHLDDVG